MRAQYSRGQPVRPAGGSRSTTEALARCLEGRGGRIRTSAPVDRIEVIRGRAVAVHAGGSRFTARQGIVSSIDPRRLFNGLLAEADVPPALRLEIDRIHSGIRNVAELKIDAVIDGELPPVSVPGFERSFMVSANTLTDLESAFAHISLGNLPERPPLTMAIRSALEAGWAPSGRNVLWVQTRIPWQPDSWSWDSSRLESAARKAWQTAERALGHQLDVTEWRITGPPQWLERIGGTSGNPNHVDMSIDQLLNMRPAPSLSSYRTPIPGLYLTGAGTHPGGGISGLPGRNIARQVRIDAHLARKPTWQQIREQAALPRDALRAVKALRA